MINKVVTGGGTTILTQTVVSHPLSCLMVWSRQGRLDQDPHETGSIELLSEELADRYQAWVISHGGYFGTSAGDDYLYHYLMLPQITFAKLLPKLRMTLLAGPMDEALFVRLKSRLLERLKNQPNFNLSPLSLLLESRSGKPASSQGQTIETLENLTLENYLTIRRQFLAPESLVITYVGPEMADRVVTYLKDALPKRPAAAANDAPVANNPAALVQPQCLMRVDESVTVAVGYGFRRLSIFEQLPLALYASTLQMQAHLFVRPTAYFSREQSYFMLTAKDPVQESLTTGESGTVFDQVIRELRFNLLEPEVDPLLWAQAKNIAEKQFFEENEGLLGRCLTLSYFESQGGYHLIENYLERIRSCQIDELENLLRPLSERQPDFLVFAPALEKAKTLMEDIQHGFRQPALNPPAIMSSPVTTVTTLANHPPYRSSDCGPRIANRQESFFTLNNGLRVVCLPNQNYPLDTFGLYLKGGRIYEGEHNCGITQLLFSSLLATLHHPLSAASGAQGFSFGRAAEWLGGYVEADVTADISGVRGFVIDRFSKPLLDALTHLFFVPSLPEPWLIEGVKQAQLSRFLRRNQDLFHRTVDLFYQAQFGIHPYGLSRYGVQESLNKLNQKDLYDWHQSWILPSKAVLVLQTREPVNQVQSMLQQWHWPTVVKPENKTPAEILSLNPFSQGGQVWEVDNREDNRTACVIGFRVPVLRNETQYTLLDLVQHALTGPGGVIMGHRNRPEKTHLQRAKSFFVPLAKGGILFVYVESLGGDPQKLHELVTQSFESLCHEGLSPQQLKRAQRFAAGSHAVTMQSPMHQTYELARRFLLQGESFGDNDYLASLQRISVRQVQELLASMINLNRATTILVKGAHAIS